MKHAKVYAAYWDHIGTELGVNISIIERDHPRDSLGCFRKMLQAWLDSTLHPTWKILEDAINIVLKQGNYLCDD